MHANSMLQYIRGEDSELQTLAGELFEKVIPAAVAASSDRWTAEQAGTLSRRLVAWKYRDQTQARKNCALRAFGHKRVYVLSR
jgi:hypothetical protein